MDEILEQIRIELANGMDDYELAERLSLNSDLELCEASDLIASYRMISANLDSIMESNLVKLGDAKLYFMSPKMQFYYKQLIINLPSVN